jgi:hypothetical protein
MKQPVVRVLQVPHSMNRGGIEAMLMNYYKHVDRDKLQFDFLLTATHKCDYEDEILANGGKIYRVPKMTEHGPWKYMKAVEAIFKAHPEYKIVHSHLSYRGIFLFYVAKRNNLPIRIAHSHSTMGGGYLDTLHLY